jgi:hypothetical protein
VVLGWFAIERMAAPERPQWRAQHAGCRNWCGHGGLESMAVLQPFVTTE